MSRVECIFTCSEQIFYYQLNAPHVGSHLLTEFGDMVPQNPLCTIPVCALSAPIDKHLGRGRRISFTTRAIIYSIVKMISLCFSVVQYEHTVGLLEVSRTKNQFTQLAFQRFDRTIFRKTNLPPPQKKKNKHNFNNCHPEVS